jgi:hypothetical protein
MATRGGRGRGRGRGRGQGALVDPPLPPPVTIEQLMTIQAQLMQTVMDHLGEQPTGAPPPV